jgi:hypothetical protein
VDAARRATAAIRTPRPPMTLRGRPRSDEDRIR